MFSGLFVALRFGLNDDFKYEQGLVKMFLKETESYGDPVHFSQALAMKAEMFGRHGNFDLAVDVTNEMRGKYIVEEHSHLISHTYGSDRSGQCIAQSALWYLQLGQVESALQVCSYVVEELLPKMDPQNVGNSFLILYPVIWVMKDHGRANEARAAFEKHVLQTFAKRLDERGLTSDRPLHHPIKYLLDLHSSDGATEFLRDYLDWAIVDKHGLFGAELNYTMGSAGRTADTITAELCLLLAKHRSTNQYERAHLICKGFEVAREALNLTAEKNESRGMIVAYSQIKPIYDELEALHNDLPTG